jgi:hypothetical protein
VSPWPVLSSWAQLSAEDREIVPIVYQFDLKDPLSFFAMATFPLVPNDIVNVSTAPGR